MKTINKIFLLASFLYFLSGNAQFETNKISYQAIIREASNNLLVNQNIGMRISIWQGSTIGTKVYEETQSTTTNENGLVTVKIGEGTVTSGSISGIYWKEGPYFIKSEIDPAGGSSYSITAETQLLSVPMAMHSTTTSSVFGVAGFFPKFTTDSKIGNSSIYCNLDKIGVNTTNPQATFEIRAANIGTIDMVTPNLLIRNVTTDPLGTNVLQMQSSVNSDDNAIKFTNSNGDLSSAIWSFTNSMNSSKTMYLLVKDSYSPAQIRLDEIDGVQIGRQSDYLKKINFSNITIGSSATQKKVVHYTYPSTDFNNVIPNITLKQEGNFSDIFSVSTTNFSTTGFDIVIYRIDGTNWGQNLKASVTIINK